MLFWLLLHLLLPSWVFVVLLIFSVIEKIEEWIGWVRQMAC